MSKLDELKKKYYDLMVQAWNENKDILIESFVKYYGEKYRDLIVSRMNEIEFVYYAPISNLTVINNQLSEIPNSSGKENYLEYRDAYLESTIESKCVKNYIGSTDEEVLFHSSFQEFAFQVFYEKICCSFAPIRMEDKNIRTIILNIFVMTQKTLIHEVNHAISHIPLASIFDDDNRFISDIFKFGMHFDFSEYNDTIYDYIPVDDQERDLEELLTERISVDIEKNFTQKGGNLLPFDGVPLRNVYTDDLYLIEEFYQNFKELLKESRITTNKNLLVEKVGKENYQQLVSLVSQSHRKKETKQKNYIEITDIVHKMVDHSNRVQDMTNEELSNYYQKLEQQGHTIIPLHDKKTK